MRSLLALVITVSIYADLRGQERFGPGFYVTNSQDTITGYILNKTSYGTKIIFRASISGPSQTLTADDVKSFALSSGEVYLSMIFKGQANLPKTRTFIRQIVGGEIELLNYRGQFIIGSEERGRFPMAKGKTSNATTALKDRQINTGIFNILFQDCPSVKAEAQNVPIVEEKLSQLIKSYHECHSVAHREYHVKKLKRISYVGVFTGLSGSKISFANTEFVRNSPFLFRTKFPVSYQPTLGIIGIRHGRGAAAILGFQGEIAFTTAHFNGEWYYTNDVLGYAIEEITITNLDFSFVNFRVGLRLTARSHKINPYFSFGLGHQMSISSKVNVTVFRDINSITDEDNFELDMSQSDLVVWGAAGLKKNILGKHALFLDSNYEQGFIPHGGKISTLAVRLGFLF